MTPVSTEVQYSAASFGAVFDGKPSLNVMKDWKTSLNKKVIENRPYLDPVQ